MHNRQSSIVARNMQRKEINVLRKIVHHDDLIYKITRLYFTLFYFSIPHFVPPCLTSLAFYVVLQTSESPWWHRNVSHSAVSHIVYSSGALGVPSNHQASTVVVRRSVATICSETRIFVLS